MERLNFKYSSGTISYDVSPILVGVVSSGNLEVLIEKNNSQLCSCEISTSESGFENIWKAVMDDFFEKYQLINTHISINDSGASPSVVSLRLDQAIEKFKGNSDV